MMALTSQQIILLANAIPVQEIIKIVEGHMNIQNVTIRNIEYTFGSAEQISQELFRTWCYKNGSQNQIQVKLFTIGI